MIRESNVFMFMQSPAKRQRGLAEVLREAAAFTAPSFCSTLEKALEAGLPARVHFQETLGLKTIATAELVQILRRLANSDAMRNVGVLVMSGLEGARPSGLRLI